MQLISTKQHYESSNEYHKSFFSMDQMKTTIDTWQNQNIRFVFPLSIGDFATPFNEESSVFLRPIKNIKLLEHSYSFNNPDETKRFLLIHNYLIDCLFKTYEKIKKIFGENTVDLCLELNRDPEEDFEGLFIIIKTNLSPEKSLDLLDEFDEEYWLDISDEISNILEVMVRPL
ncbi:MAG: hypothetical protein U9N18_00255 [Campylobacterota bacterium]|nr:hypothetical protein [Campylobacterota bacterium]